MTFEFQFPLKIEPQRVVSCFTHWVLALRIRQAGWNDLYKLYSIKMLPSYHQLADKSWINPAHTWWIDGAAKNVLWLVSRRRLCSFVVQEAFELAGTGVVKPATFLHGGRLVQTIILRRSSETSPIFTLLKTLSDEFS